MRRWKCLQNIVCTVTYKHAWKLGRVLKNQCVWKKSEMALVEKNRAVISVTLTCRAFCSPSCQLLHSLSQTGDHYRESQDHASNLKKLLNSSMKILWVDLQKAKNNIKNKIMGYPRVERGNISLFSFCKQFWNIPTPLWFSRNPLRELHGQNIFTWTTVCLQRIISEIRRGLN